MALSGMTGFGRAEGALGAWSWAVEARSVNGRTLEVRFKGPPGFDGLERAAREAGQARFQRGQVSLTLQARRAEAAAGSVSVNVEQMERYLAVVAPYVADGRLAPPSADGVLALRGVIEAADVEEAPEARAEAEAGMTSAILLALDALKAARLEEGAALAPVLAGQVDRIEALVAVAGTQAGDQPAVIRDRFARRLTELAGEAATQERILQEAAAMGVKADVQEELDRLAGHVTAARLLLTGEGPAGRRLDFLTQEFMREANTLCSKSATPALTATGLELKAVIEQFREQVQNVE
ncbi:YicC family protein [Caulobacter sp. SLTY]|uniref:YicC/YloC family endoribonuclease n=1 Tax=Caulobacter sp. SLTY TaxID=2683262 RepID=UPI001412A37B|nr:YicC/YloC family endoribonuclease [Caulobacter sp. SLTY]NBB17075.1 YicC family protein [Caulobacter sp. SLTY]